MHRVHIALLVAGILAMGVGSIPAQGAEVQPGTDQAASAPASSASPRTGASPLRRLPPLPAGSRLSGEQASALAPVYVTRRQAAARTRFRLGTLSSVSVLPESGTVAVALNGVNVGVVPVGAAYGLRVTELDIPGGLLRPGWNSVGIAAHHRHRVDCSVDAADELWSRVDPAETGLMFADGTIGFPDLADIAAIGPRSDGAVPIGVRLDNERLLKPETVERIGRAVQGIALAGRFAQPVVEFEMSGDDGLDLVLGTATDVAGRIGRASIGEITGPTVAVVPGIGSRRPLIVVTGRSDGELDEAIAQLGIIAPVGSGPGLNALGGASGHPIGPDGESLAIGDVGVEKQELFGRTLRVGFDAALPNDFLPADYGRASIDLAGGYAAGLGADAQIMVEVNGHDAGSVRLSSANGEYFRHKRHFLPLSAFRPGQNRIELRVNAPDGPGVGCDTSADSPPHARVWLNAATKVVFPPLARVGRAARSGNDGERRLPVRGHGRKNDAGRADAGSGDARSGPDYRGTSRPCSGPADSVFLRYRSANREIRPCSRRCAGACA